MSSHSTLVEELCNVATLPGMDQTVSLALQIIQEYVPRVKVCKVRCNGLSVLCFHLLFGFSDRVERDKLTGDEFVKWEERVSRVIESTHRKTRKWSRMGRLRSWTHRRSIKRELTKVDEALKACINEIQAPRVETVPVVAVPTPLEFESAVFDISNAHDFNSLAETMQVLQTEMRRPSLGTLEQIQYQRQLRHIYRETQILPPMADLTGEVRKVSDEALFYGDYNYVYEGIWLDEIKVALKFARAVNHSERARKRFLKEIEIWRDLQHPHVARLLGTVVFGTQVLSVSLWMENHDALRYINSTEEIIDRLRILRDVSSGIEYLHFRKIVHGDLRAVNVLIDATGSACVSGFGLSMVVRETEPDASSPDAGDTPVRWQARELVVPDDYGGHVPISFQSDVWSFGMLCLEIMTGEKPYKECRRQANVVENIVAKRHPMRPTSDVVLSRGLNDQMWELMLSCWHWEPPERPSMLGIHGWLKQLKPGECNNASGHNIRAKGPMEHLQRLLSGLAELNLTSQNIDIKGVKAVGGFSDVLNGCWIRADTGEAVDIAIKRLRINLQKDLTLARKVSREIRVWSQLHHENILPLQGFIMEYEVYPSLVTEWMSNGTAMDYLKNHPDEDVMPLARGIASGLAYLHGLSIVHGDMKSANIMMSNAKTPLIMDFGISHLLHSTNSTIETATAATKGSTRWMAIELFNAPEQGCDEEDSVHTKRSDVWAFGMTIYELLCRNVPYYAIKMEPQVMFAIVSYKLPECPIDGQSSIPKMRILWDLCNKCWARAPNSRPTMDLVYRELQQLQ